MCKCTPGIKTPFCGKLGCEWPAQSIDSQRDMAKLNADERVRAWRKTPMKLDAKFYGEIRKVKDDSIVPEDEWVCFLVKDNAFAAILPDYRAKCLELGADTEQLHAVDRMIARANVWRRGNPDRLKVPDAKGEKLLG